VFGLSLKDDAKVGYFILRCKPLCLKKNTFFSFFSLGAESQNNSFRAGLLQEVSTKPFSAA